MITWMQKHKKWLVITIWISTIAFVGAGFVGWGSYDYGKQGGVVAVVGDREVSMDEYQEEYSALYDQYAKIFGESFNNDMAEKFNLKDAAYKQLLQKNLILAYADSLGLDITNEDIAKQLVKYDAFLKDGKFDKDTYVKVLLQNRTTPVKFEATLKRGILLEKIQALFEIEPNKLEIENLNKLLFVKDDIELKIISSKDIKIEAKTDELKAYWEENKNAFMSEIEYEIQTSSIDIQSSNPSQEDIKQHYSKFKIDYKKADGKIKTIEEAKADIIENLDKKFSKKEALKKYLRIKKGEEKLGKSQIFAQSELPYNLENNQTIISSKVGDLNKPIFQDGKYIIVKLTKKIKSQELPFEKALPYVKPQYEVEAKAKKLDEMATNLLKNFKGTKITGVSRESVDKIKGLSAQNAAKFLNELFSVTQKQGSVKLDDKVVLYKILDSKLGDYDKSKDEAVKSTLSPLLDQEMMTNLVKRLESTYEIQSSINTKE